MLIEPLMTSLLQYMFPSKPKKTNMASCNCYGLRRKRSKNYRQLNDVDLPRSKRTPSKNKLYPISVVQRDGSRVKIHYVGYSNGYDEWREAGDIVSLSPEPSNPSGGSQTPQLVQQPYSLYKELGIKIKQALTCGRKQSPSVKINMGFDYLLFVGGLQAAGVTTRSIQGNTRYTIQAYSDLDFLLGKNWQYRGINKHGDYAYIDLDSVEYYIRKRPKVVEYMPPQSPNGNITAIHTDAGYTLTFSFIRRCGNASTFGTNRNIFS